MPDLLDNHKFQKKSKEKQPIHSHIPSPDSVMYYSRILKVFVLDVFHLARLVQLCE